VRWFLINEFWLEKQQNTLVVSPYPMLPHLSRKEAFMQNEHRHKNRNNFGLMLCLDL
jgi:hypothetical protein